MSDIYTAKPLDAATAIWLLTQRIDYDMDDDQGRIDSIVATLRAMADRIESLERTAAAAGRALREANEREAAVLALLKKIVVHETVSHPDYGMVDIIGNSHGAYIADAIDAIAAKEQTE